VRETRTQARTIDALPALGASRAPVRTRGSADSREPGSAQDLLLLFGSEREILARIVPDDPLGILALAGRRLCERSLILDVDRVVLRAFALCASQASTWRRRPELDRWLEARVDQAIDQVQEEAGEGEREAGGAFDFFAGPLGLDARALRRACRRFNSLELSDREAFFLVAVEGRSLDAVCAERGAAVTELARRVRRALDVLRGATALPPHLGSPSSVGVT